MPVDSWCLKGLSIIEGSDKSILAGICYWISARRSGVCKRGEDFEADVRYVTRHLSFAIPLFHLSVGLRACDRSDTIFVAKRSTGTRQATPNVMCNTHDACDHLQPDSPFLVSRARISSEQLPGSVWGLMQSSSVHFA